MLCVISGAEGKAELFFSDMQRKRRWASLDRTRRISGTGASAYPNSPRTCDLLHTFTRTKAFCSPVCRATYEYMNKGEIVSGTFTQQGIFHKKPTAFFDVIYKRRKSHFTVLISYRGEKLMRDDEPERRQWYEPFDRATLSH